MYSLRHATTNTGSMKSKKTKQQPPRVKIKGSKAADWIDKQQLMELFPISNRSLQNYRDKKIIPFAMLGGKPFYFLPGILKALEDEANRQSGIE